MQSEFDVSYTRHPSDNRQSSIGGMNRNLVVSDYHYKFALMMFCNLTSFCWSNLLPEVQCEVYINKITYLSQAEFFKKKHLWDAT